jgi:hypothetical protein
VNIPSLSMASVIKAACAQWSDLHPETPADPVTSPWSLVVTAVDCWLRHAMTQYDQVRTNKNRSELQAAIRVAARRQYPWLRSEPDPRIALVPTEEPPLLLNALSRELNNIVEARANLTRKRLYTKDRSERAAIDAELNDLDRKSIRGRKWAQEIRDGHVKVSYQVPTDIFSLD